MVISIKERNLKLYFYIHTYTYIQHSLVDSKNHILNISYNVNLHTDITTRASICISFTLGWL